MLPGYACARKMPSLLQVLHDATGHGAMEIVLEPDRHPTLRTSLGVETMDTVLAESELFDALAGVLGPDQQAELAVGNVVEFQVHDGVARWQLVAEAGRDGVVVRGRTGEAAVAEVGVPLELPPLRRTEGAPIAGGAVPGPRKTRDTAWDLPAVTTTPPPTPGPAQIPSWLVAGGGDDGGAALTIEPDPIDFAIRRRPPTGEPPASLEDATESSAPIQGRSDPFAGVAAELPDGALCLVRGHGHGERIARHLGPYALILDRSEASSVRSDLPNPTFVLRLEDPSELLGWMLRRVEEGARVIVEVQARSVAGARRVLLGINAAASAQAWLSAVPTFWVTDEQGRWQLTRE